MGAALRDHAFPYETVLEFDDLYRGQHSWTELSGAAGFAPPLIGKEKTEEAKLGRGIVRLLHLDDQERIDTYTQLLTLPQSSVASGPDKCARRQFEGLLLAVLSPRKGRYASLDKATAHFWQYEALRHELFELLPLLKTQTIQLPGTTNRQKPRKKRPTTPKHSIAQELFYTPRTNLATPILPTSYLQEHPMALTICPGQQQSGVQEKKDPGKYFTDR